MKFELVREQWYNLRDDRTNRIENVQDFSNYSVGVVVNPRVNNSISLQYMVLLSCNMLARWCRRITIDMVDCNTILPNQKNESFNTMIKEQLAQIDPFGDFNFHEVNESDVDQVLIIGENEKKFSKSPIWLNGSGWISGVGVGNNIRTIEDGTINPIGPAFASCLGVAATFKHAVNNESTAQYQKWYSLYDLNSSVNPHELNNPPLSTQLNFGTIFQIGCGAVGSSLDYLLSLTNWKAKLYLIDFDKIEYSNCSSSLTFVPQFVQENKMKVDVCQEILESNEKEVEPIPKSYNDFTGTSEYAQSNPDIILCLANEQNVWSTIQDSYPPLVLHATTTKNWALNFGRHIPTKEWCILCRFSDQLKDNFHPKCAEGIISTEDSGKEILGTLPFLSPAGSVLVLAELGKVHLNAFPINKNFVEFSMKPLFGNIVTQRGQKKGCICNDQSFNLYKQFRGNSKFWSVTA